MAEWRRDDVTDDRTWHFTGVRQAVVVPAIL
jgi:hypothetical protein